jgi:hypothetical protein
LLREHRLEDECDTRSGIVSWDQHRSAGRIHYVTPAERRASPPRAN